VFFLHLGGIIRVGSRLVNNLSSRLFDYGRRRFRVLDVLLNLGVLLDLGILLDLCVLLDLDVLLLLDRRRLRNFSRN
jgi:hypothetical protein